MKKNGFVFLESVLVLMIVALSVTMLLSSYSLMSRKVKEKENYDKASDKYLLYAIANLGTNSKCNYGIDCDSSYGETEFAAGAGNCENTKLGNILFDCNKLFKDLNIKNIYVVKNIRNTLNDYQRNEKGQALDCSGNVINRNTNPDAKPCKITDINKKAVKIYDNGAIEYMKTLKKCNDENIYVGDDPDNQTYVNRNKETDICEDGIMYMIGVFERGEKQYYASIDISGNVKYEETIREIKSGWICDNCSVASSAYDQEWKYYRNNVTIKGLNKIVDGNSSDAHKYYYYFDLSTGIMQTGWVYYDGEYHLFSPIDYDGQGDLDGRRIQSMNSSERISVTLKNNSGNTKQFFLDNKGTCYMAQTGGTSCSQTDISGFTGDKITSIDFGSYSGCYSCNGDECNNGATCN